MQIGFAASLRHIAYDYVFFILRSRVHCGFFYARVVTDPPDYEFAYKNLHKVRSTQYLPASIPTKYPQHLNHFGCETE